MNCPHCGKLTGRKLEDCPHCGGHLQEQAATSVRRPRRDRQSCPSCKAMVQEGDIICVVCGTNLLTGQKVSDELQAEPKIPKSQLPMMVGAGIVAAVAVLVVLAGIYIVTRDPVRTAQKQMADGKDLEAIATLSRHIDKNDGDERALELRGELHFKTNQFPRAAQDFELATNIDAKNVGAAMWGVAALHSMSGNQLDRQIALLDKVVKVDAQNTQAWYLLSLARSANRDTAGQMEALNRVIELDGGHAGAHLGLGIAMAFTGNLDGAATEMATAAQANQNGNLASVRGFLAAMRGDSQAAALLEEAVADETLLMRWQSQTQLAKLAMEEGSFRDARTLLDSALTSDAASDTVRYLRGLCLYALGDRSDAQLAFDEVSARGGVHATDALILLADTQLSLRQVDLALRSIEKASEAGARNAVYHTVRGRVAAARDKLAEARNSFSGAIKMDEDYAPAWLERGLLFIRRGAVSEGLRDLERYLEIIGEDAAGTNAEAVRTLVEQLQGSAEILSSARRIGP